MSTVQQTRISADARPLGAEAPVSVVAGYCVNLRGRIDACDLCSRVCHAGAISLAADDVSVDAACCVGCGACVPACPAGAFSHPLFDPELLPRTAVRAGTARLVCAAAGEGGGAAIPCHRMLDARLMAALFAAGAEQIEVLGAENCTSCPRGDARPGLVSAVRTLEKWFGPDAPAVHLAATGDIAQRPQSAVGRRHLLRGAFRAFSPAPEPEQAPPNFFDPRYDDDADEAVTARPVPYQQMLAAVRAELPFRADGPTGATGRLISDACSGCLVCAALCPTGALVGVAENGGRSVSFDPALCTNCTLCLKICPMAAISARALHGVRAATSPRATLFARVESTCDICGAAFAFHPGGKDICPGCENDRQMDDDWVEMLSG